MGRSERGHWANHSRTASPMGDGAAGVNAVGAAPRAEPAQQQEQSDNQRPHAPSIGLSAKILYAPGVFARV